jgi:hypothetical protein
VNCRVAALIITLAVAILAAPFAAEALKGETQQLPSRSSLRR